MITEMAPIIFNSICKAAANYVLFTARKRVPTITRKLYLSSIRSMDSEKKGMKACFYLVSYSQSMHYVFSLGWSSLYTCIYVSSGTLNVSTFFTSMIIVLSYPYC